MSSHGEKKNPDKMNTVTIATVGLAGAALVYVSIIGIESLYLNETSRVDEVAKFGKQEDVKKSLKSAQVGAITSNAGARTGTGIGDVQLYAISIDDAMKLVVDGVKVDPANLVPAVGRSEFTTIQPVFGRPTLLPSPVGLGQSAPPPAPVDPTAVPPAGEGTAAPAPPAGAEVPATGSPAAPAAPTAGAPAAPAPVAPAPAAPGPAGGPR